MATVGGEKKKCHFPFEYKGKNYDTCTKTNSKTYWCSTIEINTEAEGTYGDCSKNCDLEDGTYCEIVVNS